jgi:hypothetical protein
VGRPDADGVQDPDESGVADVTVRLLNLMGMPIGQTTTDAYGYYTFPAVSPGTYRVQVTPPAGMSFSPADQGGDDTLDNDVVSGGMTAPFPVAAGQTKLDVDAGLVGSGGSGGSGGSVGNYVWLDTDQDGVQDAGESGMGGVTVNLLNGSGAVVASTTTGPSGAYWFGGLGAGTYQVEFIAPAGATFSPQDATTDDLDSDAGGNGRTALFTLAVNQTRTDIDAGLYLSGGSGGSGIEVDVGRAGLPSWEGLGSWEDPED